MSGNLSERVFLLEIVLVFVMSNILNDNNKIKQFYRRFFIVNGELVVVKVVVKNTPTNLFAHKFIS